MKIEPLSTPRAPGTRWPLRELAAITTLVVHHTGAREVVHDTALYLRATARWIIRKYAWPGIPYHFAIGQDGAVYMLNDCTRTTYHAGTWHANISSIGLVLAGNFCRVDPTDAQLEAAAELCHTLCHGVLPHSAVVPTACPGRWERWGHLLTPEVAGSALREGSVGDVIASAAKRSPTHGARRVREDSI